MSDAEKPEENKSKKRRKRPLLLGLALAGALGGAGFYVSWSGLILGSRDAAAADADPGPAQDFAFVPVDPITISLGPAARAGHLRMTSQLEVGQADAVVVAGLMPRILDVLNGYLRAVETSELEDPAALVRLRAQMLRRIQTVTGEGRVRDLLITEFILN